MTTTYSPIFGYWQGGQLDPAIADSWGTPLSLNFTLIEDSVSGVTPIDITGQTAVTLTRSNGAVDQWKWAVIQFTGALTAPCTITVPNVNRGTGQFQNLTTGGFSLIITTGVGTTVTLPPSTTATYNYFIDASGNVTLPQIVSIGTATNDNALTGAVGEYLTATGAVSLGENVSATIATLAVPAGDWDVDGIVQFTSFTGASGANTLSAWLTTTQGAAPPTPTTNVLGSATGANIFSRLTSLQAFTMRVPAASSTPVYLTASFSAGAGTISATASGFIRARRVR